MYKTISNIGGEELTPRPKNMITLLIQSGVERIEGNDNSTSKLFDIAVKQIQK